MTSETDLRASKRRLALLWFSGAGLLFFLVLLQSIFGYYGGSVDSAWSWLLPTILPTLSLIVGVLVSDAIGRSKAQGRVDRFMFRLAFGLSAAYLVTVLLTLLLQPLTSTPPAELMQQSSLWLGPFQGLVTACLGAFFVRKPAEDPA